MKLPFSRKRVHFGVSRVHGKRIYLIIITFKIRRERDEKHKQLVKLDL